MLCIILKIFYLVWHTRV